MGVKPKFKPRGRLKTGQDKKIKTLGTGDGGIITGSIRKLRKKYEKKV